MTPWSVLCSSLLSLTITASIVIAVDPHSPSSSCPPDQRDALLQLKNSFTITGPPPIDSDDVCMNISYPKTASWRKDKDCCSWEGVTCDNSTGEVVGLDLSCARLRGDINSHSSLFSLRHLRSLGLCGNDFIGSSIPPEIRVFSRMASLNLSQSNVSGVIPTEISHLLKLVSLDLSGNVLEMQNPTMRMLVRNLTQLAELRLSSVNMSMVIPTSMTNFSSSLISLDLYDCSLGGKFFENIIQLPNLQHLDLSVNYGLHGTLPVSNWSSSLAWLSLAGCSFTGVVPHSIGSLPLLTYLDLSGNNFTGHVDFQIFSTLKNLWLLGLYKLSVSGEDATDANPKFPKLQVLDMSSCNLTKFPSFLSQSKKLQFLNLMGNMIEEIPSWFWGIGIDTLEELDLGSNLLRGGIRLPWKRLDILNLRNNSFDGPLAIPTSRSIIEFDLSQNRFNGSIPPSICQLTSLVVLYLSQNSLTGVLPRCLGNLTDLYQLDLSSNSLTGPLPPSFLQSTSFRSVDLSTNKFEGPLPLPSYATQNYKVSNNNFSGEISSLICNATKLRILDLSNNSISGTLPHCLENITKGLIYLNLRENKFHGLIPEIFSEGCVLTSLDFSRNQFDGLLPRSLSNCQSLEALDVGSNKIVDSFPRWLGDLPLKVLSLRSNKFQGHLSVSHGTRLFSKLRILDLSNNGFEGNISDNFIRELFGMARGDDGHAIGYMRNGSSPYSVMIILKGVEIEMVNINVQFATLDLSSNHFFGEIPRNIGLLKSLKGLNFSHNSFTGTIPPSIVNMTNLESLDLSSNNLVGGIPRGLVQLASLGALDLSWNNLTGPIPSGGHLNTFPNKSFEGNTGLCGIPLTRACDQRQIESQPPRNQRVDEEDEAAGWLDWKFVAMGFGSGIGIGISLGYMVLETGRPLWLSRTIIRLESGRSKTSKRKAHRRNVRR